MGEAPFGLCRVAQAEPSLGEAHLRQYAGDSVRGVGRRECGLERAARGGVIAPLQRDHAPLETERGLLGWATGPEQQVARAIELPGRQTPLLGPDRDARQ